MYCRRCGKKLEDGATSCPACGTEVVEVRQRPYAQKYREQRLSDKAQRAEARAEARATASSEAAADAEALAAAHKAAGIKADPYLVPATVTGAAAFGLAVFPWPTSWGVGTSLWMKLCILGLAIVALVLCFLAARLEGDNVRKAQSYSRGHKKRAFSYTRPWLLTVAQALAGFSALMALLSLFTA